MDRNVKGLAVLIILQYDEQQACIPMIFSIRGVLSCFEIPALPKDRDKIVRANVDISQA